ncbi:MAG: amphi-Trp domain-containing protein [Candidatus Thiodiazotropha sp. LLP2]
MRQGKKSFRHESIQDRTSIQSLLKSITQGIGKGSLVLSDDEDEMVLKPDGLLQLKVTASQDTDKHRLNLRITWTADEGEGKKQKKLKVKTNY